MYVIALDSTGGQGPGRMAIKELPAACTVGQLDALLALQRAASQRSRPSTLLVCPRSLSWNRLFASQCSFRLHGQV